MDGIREGSDFYYLGDVSPIAIAQSTIKNNKNEEKPIVNIIFDLDKEVPDHLYEYLIK